MKKSSFLALTVIIILAAVIPLLAQSSPIDRKNTLLEGGLSYSRYSGDLYVPTNGHPYSILTIDPMMAIFVAKGLAIGGRLEISRYSEEGYVSNTWGVGPELRYYFDLHPYSSIRKGTLYPYMRMALTYNSLEYGSMTTITLGGGAAIMLSEEICTFVELNYNAQSFDSDDSRQYLGPGSSSANGTIINFSMGFSFFLPR